MVGQHGDGAVVAFAAAREGGRAGSRVRHQAGAGARARRTDDVLVQHERVVDGEALRELTVAPRHGQAGRAHAVRHHEDQVALAGRLLAGGRGRAVVMTAAARLVLEHHGQHDDGDRGQHGPGEQSDLAPEAPAATLGAAVRALARQQSIFFFSIADGGVFGGGARSQQRLVSRHD